MGRDFRSNLWRRRFHFPKELSKESVIVIKLFFIALYAYLCTILIQLYTYFAIPFEWQTVVLWMVGIWFLTADYLLYKPVSNIMIHDFRNPVLAALKTISTIVSGIMFAFWIISFLFSLLVGWFYVMIGFMIILPFRFIHWRAENYTYGTNTL